MIASEVNQRESEICSYLKWQLSVEPSALNEFAPMDHPQLPTHPTSRLNASSQQIQCPHSEVQTRRWSEHLFEYNYRLGKEQCAKT